MLYYDVIKGTAICDIGLNFFHLPSWSCVHEFLILTAPCTVKSLFLTVRKDLRKTNIKKERLTLAHIFIGFSPWSAGSITFVLKWGRVTWQQTFVDQSCTHTLWSWEAETETGWDQEQNTASKGTPFSDLPPSSSFNHLLNNPFKSQIHHWINALII
jgi:hypothetical protein